MGQKRTPRMMAEAKRMRAEGRSYAEIADELSKGGKKVSKAAVYGWLTESQPNAPVPVAVPVAAPEPVEEPGDTTVMSRDEFAAWLTGQIRAATREATRARARDDHGAASRASRLAAQLAVQLAKIQARDGEDGDTVRVKVDEMREAADRAVSGLHQLADRVVEERATWPRCGSCGQPFGEFAAGDKSPLRALMERVGGRVG